MRPRPWILSLLLLLPLLPATARAAEKPSPEIAQSIVRDLADIIELPAKLRGGRHRVVLQSIDLLEWDATRLTARLRLRYQKTRGFPHYSTSGAATARFKIYPGTNGEVCVSDLEVTDIALNRIPSWFDNAWLAKELKEQLPGEVCAK